MMVRKGQRPISRIGRKRGKSEERDESSSTEKTSLEPDDRKPRATDPLPDEPSPRTARRL